MDKKTFFKLPSFWLLLTGILLFASSHLTHGIAITAWFSLVPFLIFLRINTNRFSKIQFVFALFVAWSFAVLKIVSAPIPYAMIFLYSIPLTVFQLPGYFLWMRFRNRKFGLFLLPALLTLTEWIQYSFTPFGSWGAMAYTQITQSEITQSLSLFGIAGLSFLIYLVNVTIVGFILDKKFNSPFYYLPFVAVVAIFIYGSVRISVYNSASHNSIVAAAVSTDSDVSGVPLPGPDEIAVDKATLFSRTRTAAKAGAKLIVWNEASLCVFPNTEKTFENELSMLSKDLKINLVAAYVVPVSTNPIKYKNKFLIFDSCGNTISQYHKHEPVPGEPSNKGKEPFQSFNLNGYKLSGAICYDYDFPYIARGIAQQGADIVAVPSSDWRGIDPIHSQMAAFRAIEQGHAIIRSTRYGLSAFITPVGQISASLSYFDSKDKILVSHIPTQKLPTFYAFAGDYVCWLLLIYLLLFFVIKQKQTLNS